MGAVATLFRLFYSACLVLFARASKHDRGSECPSEPDVQGLLKELFQWLVQCLLAVVIGALVFLWRKLRDKENECQGAAIELAKLQVDRRKVNCRLQDEIGDRKALEQEKEEILKELKRSRADVSVVRAHLEQADSHRSKLADLVKAHSDDAAEMKSRLSQAQEWHKECLRINKEVNDLYKDNDKKSKTIQVLKEKLLKCEGWAEEREKLLATVEEMTSKANDQAEVLESMKDAAQSAEMWKSRSNAHSEDKIKLIAGHDYDAKIWDKQAKSLKNKIQALKKQNENLKAALEQGDNEFKKLDAWSIGIQKRGEDLSKQLQGKTEELEATAKIMGTTKKQLEHIKGALDVLVVDKTKIQEELKAVNESNATEKKHLVVSLARSEALVEILQGDLERMTSKVQEEEQAMGELRLVVGAKEEEHAAELASVIEKGRQQVVEVGKALDESRKERDQLERALGEREDEVQCLKGELDMAHEMMVELQRKAELQICEVHDFGVQTRAIDELANPIKLIVNVEEKTKQVTTDVKQGKRDPQKGVAETAGSESRTDEPASEATIETDKTPAGVNAQCRGASKSNDSIPSEDERVEVERGAAELRCEATSEKTDKIPAADQNTNVKPGTADIDVQCKEGDEIIDEIPSASEKAEEELDRASVGAQDEGTSKVEEEIPAAGEEATVEVEISEKEAEKEIVEGKIVTSAGADVVSDGANKGSTQSDDIVVPADVVSIDEGKRDTGAGVGFEATEGTSS